MRERGGRDVHFLSSCGEQLRVDDGIKVEQLHDAGFLLGPTFYLGKLCLSVVVVVDKVEPLDRWGGGLDPVWLRHLGRAEQAAYDGLFRVFGPHVVVQVCVPDEPSTTARDFTDNLPALVRRNPGELVQEVRRIVFVVAAAAEVLVVETGVDVWAFFAEVDVEDVLLEPGLASEALPAAFFGPVPVLESGRVPGVDFPAHEAHTLVCGAVVDFHVGLFGEALVATGVFAGDVLAVLDRETGVVDLHVLFQLVLPAEFHIAKHAVDVRLPDVLLQEPLCREPHRLAHDGLRPSITGCLGGCLTAALGAPEAKLAMCTRFV